MGNKSEINKEIISGIFNEAFFKLINYFLLNTKRLQSVGNVAADLTLQKSSCQASEKWQQVLQMTLKTAFLQDDQEIQNLTSLVVFSFNAACFISIKNTIWQKTYLRNQHPGLREELCSMNYSVFSAFLTGNFSSLNSCSQQLFQSVGLRNNPLQQLFVQKVNIPFYISQQHLPSSNS